MREIFEALTNWFGPEKPLGRYAAFLWLIAAVGALGWRLYPLVHRQLCVWSRRWKVSQLDQVAQLLLSQEQHYIGAFLENVRARNWDPRRFVRPDLKVQEKKYEPIDPILVLLDRATSMDVSPEMSLLEKKEKFQTERIRDLFSALKRLRGLMILGEPGSGKTTCLLQLGTEIANRALLSATLLPRLPLFIPLNEFVEDISPETSAEVVLAFVRDQVRQQTKTHKEADISNRLDVLIRDGRLIFLFDALDEMPRDGYYERFRALSRFMKTCWAYNDSNLFVFSCRKLDYVDDPTFPIQQVFLSPFSSRQIKAFFKRYIPGKSGKVFDYFSAGTGDLQRQARSPFFLSLVSACVEAQLPLGATWDVLLTSFVDIAIDKDRQRRGMNKVEWQSIERDTKSWLSGLAFDIVESRATGTKADADMVRDSLDSFGAGDIVIDVAASCGLVRRLANGALRFEHHRLQEYFAARKLAAMLDADECDVFDYLDDIWWREVVLMTSGLMNHPDVLIDQILSSVEERGFSRFSEIRADFSRVMVAMACYRPAIHKLGISTRQRLSDHLVQFLRHGNILQKVRALRVVPDFATAEIYAVATKLLRDQSPWVREVALGVLADSVRTEPSLSKAIHGQMFSMVRGGELLVDGLREFPVLFRFRFTRLFIPIYIIFALLGLLRATAVWLVLCGVSYWQWRDKQLSSSDLGWRLAWPIILYWLMKQLARRRYMRFRWNWISSFNGFSFFMILWAGITTTAGEFIGRVEKSSNRVGSISANFLEFVVFVAFSLYWSQSLMKLYTSWRERILARRFNPSGLEPERTIQGRTRQAERVLHACTTEQDPFVRIRLLDLIGTLLPLDGTILRRIEGFCESELDVTVRTKAYRVFEQIELSVERERGKARGQSAP